MSVNEKMILILTVVLLTASFDAMADDTLVFGVLENLPPYEYLENGQMKGLGIEIGEELSKRLGIEIRYNPLPWARMKKFAEEGEIDGILSMYCLEKYLEVMDFAESPIKAEISFFSLKESAVEMSGIDSLKGRRVGGIRGYTYTPEFAKYKDMISDECVDDKMLVKKLERGRFEVALAESISFRFFSKKLGFQDRFRKLYVLTEHKICMGFSKKALGAKSRVWAERVSGIFQKMRKDGTIQNILDKCVR